LDEERRWNQDPSIAVDEHGAIIIVYSSFFNIFMRKSYNSGVGWTPVDSIQPHHLAYLTGDVVYSAGRILIGWEDEPPPPSHTNIYFYQSSDNGQTWEDEIWINRDTSAAYDPVIAASKTKIYAIWFDDKVDSISICGLYFSRWPANISQINDTTFNSDSLHFSVEQYPNPFNTNSIIQYTIPIQSTISIDIYDILGRKVIKSNEGIKYPGTHQYLFNADGFTSGIYFYRICAGEYVQTGSMFLIK